MRAVGGVKVGRHGLAQPAQVGRVVGQDGLDAPPRRLDHLVLAVDRPHHHVLVRGTRVAQEPLAVRADQRGEAEGKGVAVLPEVAACIGRRSANVRAAQRGHVLLRRRNEARVPQTQDEARSELRLVVRELLHDFAHDAKEAVRVVVRLDIDIQLDVPVTRFHQQRAQLLKRRNLLHGLLRRAHMLETALTIVLVRADRAVPIRRAVQRRVMEHDNHVVGRYVHVWRQSVRRTALDALRAILDGLRERTQRVLRKLRGGLPRQSQRNVHHGGPSSQA